MRREERREVKRSEEGKKSRGKTRRRDGIGRKEKKMR